MSDGMQMTNCGGCKSCLVGGYVHGPYPHHFECTSGGKRVHRYGPGGSSFAGGCTTLPPEVAYDASPPWGEEKPTEEDAIARQKAKAEQEEHERRREERLKDQAVKRRVNAAEKRLGRSLTAREVALVYYAEKDAERRESQLTKKQRRKLEEILGQQARHKQLQRERNREIERRRAERGPGLTERAIQEIKKEVSEQFAQEIRELEKQLAESKAEMKKMLSGER